MSRVLILLLFVLWMTWREGFTGVASPLFWPAMVLFVAGFALVILFMGLWGRVLARRVRDMGALGGVNRFNRMIFIARLMIVLWFGVGLYALGWGEAVTSLLGPVADGSLATPGAMIGTLPALLAWAGLWWSQYPMDRALREQNMLAQLERDLPVYAPPPFVSYFMTNLRLQLLFTVAPVLLLLAAHDVIQITVLGPLHLSPDRSPILTMALLLGASGLIYLLAPELLRHVLHTQPMADSSLRRRLEAMCRKYKLRYRDILLWRTQGSLGNAAVMGVIPRFRYILMSDLLLETMSDAQIEAVFAHELGHIVHKHMWWYLVFVAIFLFTMAGPGDWLVARLDLPWVQGAVMEIVLTGIAVVGFLLAFGFVSRRFERQADVFAARALQREAGIGALDTVLSEDHSPPPTWSYVGPYGATLFGGALQRVAVVNNIPVSAPSWCHGSIRKRMTYLEQLGMDPARTRHFDGFMQWLYRLLMLTLLVTMGWTIIAGL